jgi:hypothetical protein
VANRDGDEEIADEFAEKQCSGEKMHGIFQSDRQQGEIPGSAPSPPKPRSGINVSEREASAFTSWFHVKCRSDYIQVMPF